MYSEDVMMEQGIMGVVLFTITQLPLPEKENLSQSDLFPSFISSMFTLDHQHPSSLSDVWPQVSPGVTAIGDQIKHIVALNKITHFSGLKHRNISLQ